MGTFSKGILGGFSGKVGTVVGASWRGKDIMRSLPKKSDRQPTEEQQIVRAKFKLVTQFLAPLRGLLGKYYGQNQGLKSRRNLATSYHITNAVAGIFPDFTIDFANVIFAVGEILGLQDPVVSPQPNAELAISWTDNTGQGLAKADDTLVVIAFNDDRRLFEIRDMVAVRTALSYTMTFPASWAGETVHVYMAFASAEGKKCSTSIYMGPQLLQ